DPAVGALFARFGLTPDGVRGAHVEKVHEPISIDDPPRETLQVGDRTSGATGCASASAADALRILDAAANRGREGLRVVEDAARFLLNDAHLCGLLKSVRHELTAALTRL